MGVLARLIVAALLCLSATGEAFARRVALVIGNADYANAGRLSNPVNDAADVAAKLREIGFEVIDGYDLGKRGMEQKIGAFADALHDATTGLFFFAGHGLQVDGRNYLIPIDARLDIPTKLRLEAVQADDVIELMSQQVATSLIFLDACRNNPFSRSLTRSAKTRGVQVADGLGQIDSIRGSFIAFSTAPGAVAMDGTGRNSPFATALLRHITTPGLSINDMMISVRRDVLKETRDFQTPMSWDSLTDRFSFVPEEPSAPAIAVPPAAPVAVPAQEPPAADVAMLDQPAAIDDLEATQQSVEAFLKSSYLAPRPDAIEEDINRIYMDQVVSYGAVYAKDRLMRVKKSWFRRYKAWQIDLVRGSLTIDPADGGRVHATFFIDYVYERRTGKPVTGRAGVKLELVPGGGTWRVASEQKFP